MKARIQREYRKLGTETEDMPDSIKEVSEKEAILSRVSAFVNYLRGTDESGREEGAQEEKDTVAPGLMFKKDANGRWWWFGVVTNNRLDKDDQIITSEAHRRFVRALDDGTYEKVMGQPHPEFWFWHIPVPIGESHFAAYDERGFLAAAGPQKEGDFYTGIFEKMAAYAARNPGTFAMSHGAPYFTIEFNKDDDSLIEAYMSKEFTILPRHRAANEGTVAGVMSLSKGEAPMQVEERKRAQFVEIFGEDSLSQFDNLLSDMSEAADAAGIPKKEKDDMAEEDKTVQTEEKEEELEVEEVEKQDEEEEEEEEDEEEMPAKEENDYITRAELDAALKQAADGIGQGVRQAVAEIREAVDGLGKELKDLRESDEERLAKKAAETPTASYASIFAESIVGKEAAELDYNKERKLRTASPDEVDKEEGDGPTGIPSLDKMIKKQQGRSRAVQVAHNGQ